MTQTEIMDEPIPKINVSVLKPTPFKYQLPSIKNFVKKTSEAVNKKIYDFSNWVLSYVPKPVWKVINERVELLKDQIKDIYHSYNYKKSIKPQKDGKKQKIDKGATYSVDTLKSAFKGFLKTYRIEADGKIGPIIFLNRSKQNIIKLINSQKKPIKIKLILTCELMKVRFLAKKESYDYDFGYFHSTTDVITESTDLYTLFSEKTFKEVIEQISHFIKNGSGWIFNKVMYLDIHIDPFSPIKASSYFPLPKLLANKKALINVQNKNDNECFKWAVTSAVYPAHSNPQCLTKEMRINSEKFDWTGIDFLFH